MNKSLIKLTLQIGKEGITDGVIKNLKGQLKKRKVVKVKFLKSAIELAKELVEKCNGKLVEIRRNTAVIEKI